MAALPQYKANDRFSIFGGTGSGKSVLAHYFFARIPAGWWKVCVDITDSVNDVSMMELRPFQPIPWNDSYSFRFVPDLNGDIEAQINYLYMQIFAHGICTIWLDEGNEVSTAHRTIRAVRTVLLQGRKAMVGQIMATPRPADIDMSFFTQSQFIAVFSLIAWEDRYRVARNFGMARAEFDEEMFRLPTYGFLFYEVASHRLWRMPPLSREVITRLNAISSVSRQISAA